MNDNTCKNCEWYYKEHCANGESDNCTEPMADNDSCEEWLNKDEYNAYTNAVKSVKPITNLEKLSQINNMANLIYGYGTSFYDKYYCRSDCPCEKGALKSDCLKCIKQWLESEAVI